MKISIITLTWNSEETVGETVASVLMQNYSNLEHIIVDNKSNDNTLQIVRELYKDQPDKLKVISEKDKGISDGFNKGIKAATGEIVAFLNSDDKYLSPKILNDVSKAFKEQDVMYVHGDMIFEDPKFGTNRRPPLMCSLEEAMPYNHPTFFAKKLLFERHGLFDLNYKFTMDFHFMCRLYKDAKTPRYKSIYLNDYPMVKMAAGGVSWEHELKSITELEKALKEFGFYTNYAQKSLNMRRSRIKMRNLLEKLGLSLFVKLWRKFKW